MPVNMDKSRGDWKADTTRSVAMYNDWFVKFAPEAFRRCRAQAIADVAAALRETSNLTRIEPVLLRSHPEILPTLRMATCPPLAVDRLIGLAGVSDTLVNSMEDDKRLPPRLNIPQADLQLRRIAEILVRMADREVFAWIGRESPATPAEVDRAATIVADRLCSARAHPIIRNEQEKRQLAAIKAWLEQRDYRHLPSGEGTKLGTMRPGTFSLRMNVAGRLKANKMVNIPIDACIMPKLAQRGDLPLFFEAKSAGDFANTNKRQKEEATKTTQLRDTYGADVRFNLFLCGYFDYSYLSYEAAKGIDWVWEHRIDDLALFEL